jgi:hypothetical protein
MAARVENHSIDTRHPQPRPDPADILGSGSEDCLIVGMAIGVVLAIIISDRRDYRRVEGIGLRG